LVSEVRQRHPPPDSGWSGELDESALTRCSAPPPDPYRNEYGCGDACCCGDADCRNDCGGCDRDDEHAPMVARDR